MIGLGLGLGALSRAMFPPFWGWLADRLHARPTIVWAATTLAGAALLLTTLPVSSGVLLGLLCAHGLLVAPVLPLAEAITLSVLGERRGDYGRIRLWGSIGFVITALGVGAVVRAVGISAVAWVAGAPLLLAGWTAVRLPPPAPVPHHGWTGPDRRLDWRCVIPLLVIAALGQAAHGPYYTLFTLDMAGRGVAPWLIGSLWAWAVIAEIALMAASPGILSRLRLVTAMRIALALAAVRWLVYATDPPLIVIIVGQALHAASFALFHISCVQLIDRFSPAGRKALGQSVLSAVAYGVGGGAGMFAAGRLVQQLGLPALYVGAAALCVVGFAVSWGMSAGSEGRPPD
jgi:PPP family 3-phenylpropionic acid transporter